MHPSSGLRMTHKYAVSISDDANEAFEKDSE